MLTAPQWPLNASAESVSWSQFGARPPTAAVSKGVNPPVTPLQIIPCRQIRGHGCKDTPSSAGY